MDRLAAHVIATAALTVTLATVPVLFADASHAATRSVPVSAAVDPSSRPAALARSADETGSTEPPLAAATETTPAPAVPATAPLTPAGTGRTYTLPQAARPCTDLRQVGGTTHARYHGVIAFSVRQYYSASCRAYYGYSFAWERFRRLHVRYDVGMAVFDQAHDRVEGARTYVGGAGGPGYWSAAVPAVQDACTHGEGHYFYYPAKSRYGFEEGDALSPTVCA